MALRLVKGGQQSAVEFPLFDSLLDRSGKRQLRSLVTVIAVARGQVVVKAGDVGQDLLVVSEGVLKLWKGLSDGRRQIVAFRASGDLVSMHRCNTPWPVTAQAVSDCRLLQIDWEDLHRLTRRYPAMERALLDQASDEITNLQGRLLTIGCKSTEERLASFMLEFFRPSAVPSSLTREIHLPMRRSEIAEYLGITTESVSREFSRLKRRRIIAMPRPSRVVVLNWHALEDLAFGASAPAGWAEGGGAGLRNGLVVSE